MTPLEQELFNLLTIHSPTGKEDVISTHIKSVLRPLTGLQCIEQGLGLIYFNPPNPNKQTLALYGHLDSIVAAAVEPNVDEHKIYGLGASDMKGGLAVMMELLKNFDPEKSAYNLQVIFYDKEEGPYLENGLGPILENQPFLRQADLALVLEPTDNQVQVGCLGGLHALVTFMGKTAHSARPWQGDNALHKAWPLLKKLSELTKKRYEFAGLEFFEVLNATQAKTTNSRNSIPGGFELNLNYRFAPSKSIEQAKEELITFIGTDAEVTFVDECPSAPAIANNPLLSRLVNEHQLKIEPKQAWTDIARLAQFGIEAANFGPGQSAQAHQAGEWIDRKLLQDNLHLLTQFLYPL